ncbi:uncharacterized protein F5Z01DRAFT_640481 [Emericellopsis atlantica]|uniref:Aminoglycoside phosphotransferase domain-containing protein n=1 Tax=Emericellopsis atlantica TaxID=2614577 RepID=A0A9P8CK63_9HYPO|nr:uncharacterized protein F5Z01DRAFT_640481 [Emericellopsis atlantica]KAG9250229.1 hypothetical protein F5Z01DRAFT_640481 [Emericellopsis atlantica]
MATDMDLPVLSKGDDSSALCHAPLSSADPVPKPPSSPTTKGPGFLHHGRWISITSAGEEESNIILAIRHRRAANKFRQWLWNQREDIAALVRSHLHLPKDDANYAFEVIPTEYWRQGGFNMCVLVVAMVGGRATSRFVFRCPLPHKLAESQYPGTMDEKIRCEVASYVWMQEHCRDVRIPALHSFGFSDGSQFTHISQASFYTRVARLVRRLVHRILELPLLSNYNRNTSAPAIGTPYMLLEFVGPEVGNMLSITWEQHMNDTKRRARLYEGMSRIMLSLTRLPQTRIGCYRFNLSDATITLTNRPLLSTTIIFENAGTPRTIQPTETYYNTDGFLSDMLSFFDDQFLQDPHAIRDEDDAYERIALRTLLRAVAHHFIIRHRRNGPFLLQLTDFHQSNILVDDDWNITCLIDLEWICALPIEMLEVPDWLTNRSPEQLTGEHFDQFDNERQIFLGAMDEMSKKVQQEHDVQIMRVIRDSWTSKGVWFWTCIRSINLWLFLIEDHILPKFSYHGGIDDDLKRVSTVWREGVAEIVEAKQREEAEYLEELQHLIKEEIATE